MNLTVLYANLGCTVITVVVKVNLIIALMKDFKKINNNEISNINV